MNMEQRPKLIFYYYVMKRKKKRLIVVIARFVNKQTKRLITSPEVHPMSALNNFKLSFVNWME